MTDTKSSTRTPPTFTAAAAADQISIPGIWRGIQDIFPLLLGVAPVGIAYGIAALEKGLTPLETILTSAMIFGGASQFLAIELWQHPLPVTTLILAVLAVNARHLVMGASLTPWLRNAHPLKVYPSLYFMTDEIWGLMMRTQKSGRPSEIGELLGAGVIFYMCWVGSTAIGTIFGGLINDPAAWGLDVLGVCFFIALLMAFWTGTDNLIPWCIAAGVSLLVGQIVEGSFNVILGACAGVCAGVVQERHSQRYQ